MKTVWLDALTPKQARLMGVFAEALRSSGIDVVPTCREYEYTVGTFRLLGIEPAVLGRHGGGELGGKLRADVERMRLLARFVEEREPDLLITYPNPSATRVAFGLGIPILMFNDTPHSVPACRLSCPLASTLVYSEFIPRRLMERFVLKEWTRVRRYRGVEELAWVLRFKPDPGILEELGLEEGGYILVRPEERKAAYYGEGPVLVELAVSLARKGHMVVVLPRYREQAEALKGVANIVIPEDAVDGPSLEYYAAAVVTGGGTMAREAALLGTPGINLFPRKIHVDEALSRLGLPLYKARSLDEAEKLCLKFLASSGKVDTSEMLRGLEDPVKVMREEVERLLA